MSSTKKLALVGYGRMGRLIEQLAPQHGFEIFLRLDSKSNANSAGINPETFANVDAAIEFTTPEIAPSNLRRLANAKKDAPSGTLLQLVRTMEQSGYSRNIDVSSNRAGKHPGTHEVGFDSAADTITLRHVARSREGFAHGALKAAQWILDRKGVYK